MKNLVMIAHTSQQQEIADRLRQLKQVRGFTFTHGEGHGAHTADDPFLSTRDKVVGYVPAIRLDILLDDGDLDSVLGALRDTVTGIAGQGVYWVTDVIAGGRL
jgi:nitrogen regulatory protein P-II 1